MAGSSEKLYLSFLLQDSPGTYLAVYNPEEFYTFEYNIYILIFIIFKYGLLVIYIGLLSLQMTIAGYGLPGPGSHRG